ncbi:hypothetical protein MKW98_018787 [Papaver atlanticum]|uniref:Uncharacterized protein n=1 Tax=Papaver atlanticum TaxID=357466 RepID=A0AAD4T2J4_9MAGN|nr:hypothetical protein MKW98_018787 [Papaver atlanticum]
MTPLSNMLLEVSVTDTDTSSPHCWKVGNSTNTSPCFVEIFPLLQTYNLETHIPSELDLNRCFSIGLLKPLAIISVFSGLGFINLLPIFRS